LLASSCKVLSNRVYFIGNSQFLSLPPPYLLGRFFLRGCWLLVRGQGRARCEGITKCTCWGKIEKRSDSLVSIGFGAMSDLRERPDCLMPQNSLVARDQVWRNNLTTNLPSQNFLPLRETSPCGPPWASRSTYSIFVMQQRAANSNT
jgi:hypothetical protein